MDSVMETTTKYVKLPRSEVARTGRKVLLDINGVLLSKCILFLPIFGFISCVGLAILYNFEEATRTHCRVANYLPSISAAIGGFTPQRYIWRICIGLHCGPRIVLAVGAYLQDYCSFPVYQNSYLYRALVWVNALLHLVENACLVLLSMISSNENHNIHVTSFILFIVCSELYMICTLILFNWSRSSRHFWTSEDVKSFRLKKLFLFVNLLGCFGAGYTYYRHNTFCEPGVYSLFCILFLVYTLFAFCEYTVVLTNIFFHGTAVIDFAQGHLKLVNSHDNVLIDKAQ